MSVMRLSSGKWRVQIRRKHLRVDEIVADEESARALEAESLAEHEEGRGQTLAGLWQRYSASQQFAAKAEHTQRTERTRIQPVLARLGSSTLAALSADPSCIYDYIDDRSKAISPRTRKRLSRTSVRLEVAALSAVIAFAKQRCLVLENFVSTISRPVAKKRRRRISSEEQGKLKLYTRSADPAVATAARFMLAIRHLGCRPGELRELLVADVVLNRRELTFRDTKNGTDRCVHITSEAAELLHLQLDDGPDDSPYVFSSRARSGGAWVPYNYSSGVRLLRELKIIAQDMAAHAGRREFVSRAIENNVPIATIKKQTGHRSSQAVEIYDEGLSTAPAIRDELDKLAQSVKDENLTGVFESLGLTDEQREKLRRQLSPSGWISFDGAVRGGQ